MGIRARTLFSAVHGIISIGLDRKLVALPLDRLDTELVAFVDVYVAGLRATETGRCETGQSRNSGSG